MGKIGLGEGGGSVLVASLLCPVTEAAFAFTQMVHARVTLAADRQSCGTAAEPSLLYLFAHLDPLASGSFLPVAIVGAGYTTVRVGDGMSDVVGQRRDRHHGLVQQ